jgi:aminopeptidase YwaD
MCRVSIRSIKSPRWLALRLVGFFILGAQLTAGCQPHSAREALLVGSIEPAATSTQALATPAPAAEPTAPATATTLAARLLQGPASEQPGVAVEEAPARAPATFSGAQAQQTVEYLANEIGSRVAGTSGEARAADYLAGRLGALGLTAELQPFTIQAYDDRGSTLEVVQPSPQSLDAQTLVYSPAGQTEGDLVDVGLGRAGDFDPAAVQGKVALARRGETRFLEKVTTLAAAGARAVIVYNNQPGNFAGNLGERGAVPSVSLSQEQGERLVSLAGSGAVTVRLRVDADDSERTARNVVASGGSGPRTVVIGAHYDSVRAGPGANDNASGTATMLEVARVVSERRYPFAVRFVAFGAEEIGLLGSRHYVSTLGEAERNEIAAMINLDMVGVGDRLSFGGDPVLVEQAIERASAIGIAAERMRDRGSSSSDHASFMAVGIPALFVYRGEDPNYHTAGDRAEHVRPEHLEVAGRIVLGLLDELAADTR